MFLIYIYIYIYIYIHRLGLHPSDNMPRICACGTRLGDNPYHYHSCTFLRRRHVTIRHDMVLDLMKRLVRESGGLALVEDHWRLHDWPDLGRECHLPMCPFKQVHRQNYPWVRQCPRRSEAQPLRASGSGKWCCQLADRIRVHRGYGWRDAHPATPSCFNWAN